MVCYIVSSICACIASTCSRVGGGGGSGLTFLLFSPLLLVLLFLVLAISCISVDKIKNTQESDSRGKGLVEENP
jgi:hypothetical protein